ncbi:spermidine synthase [Aureococcus anophagefferens]|uniref:Spermidine synthase n=1 Tax=Aureococcus anophagefferens TaxID=44056 RepID=A0ABR1FL86_AURAN
MSSTKKDKKFYHATAAQAYYMKPSEAATVSLAAPAGSASRGVGERDRPRLGIVVMTKRPLDFEQWLVYHRALLLRPPWNAFVDATFVAKTQRDYFVQMDRQAVNVASYTNGKSFGRVSAPGLRAHGPHHFRGDAPPSAGSATVDLPPSVAVVLHYESDKAAASDAAVKVWTSRKLVDESRVPPKDAIVVTAVRDALAGSSRAARRAKRRARPRARARAAGQEEQDARGQGAAAAGLLPKLT